MRKLDCGRRNMLRLMAFAVTFGWALDTVSARSAKRKRAPVRMPTVVIDPGHGGVDPGAISPSGVNEKEIVLAVAREFARQLAATRRYRVVLTRSADEFISLRERVARARAWDADVFLSIHADALPDRAMRGLSVFTLSARASDREAATLAIRENRADLLATGINLARQSREIGITLMDLARRQTSNLSIVLSRSVVDQLAPEVVLLENPRRSADFAVLTAPDIPSVLIELGCLSNPQEHRLLQRRAYQQKLARGLVRAVEGYFGHMQ